MDSLPPNVGPIPGDWSGAPLALRDAGPRPEGHVALWERPDQMSLREFLAFSGDELLDRLGPAAAEADNIFVNGWYADVFTVMTGGTANLTVGALCLGTGSNVVARTDYAMSSEWNRYSPIAVSVGSTDPTAATLSYYSPASDGAATITEVGLFHGGATTAPLTGRMSTHTAFAYSKPGTQDVRIDYTCTRSLT